MKNDKTKPIPANMKLIALTTIICFFFSTGIRAQVTASFTVNTSEGCSPLQVNFTNTSSSLSGDPLEYVWKLGDGSEVTTKNVTHAYNIGKETPYTAKLIAINSNDPNNDRDTFDVQIHVIQTPSAALVLSTQDACVNELVKFNFSGAIKDSLRLDFGDGTFSQLLNSPITHRYKDHSSGFMTIKLYTYYKGCADTNESKTIIIQGPIVEYDISEDSACIDNDITYKITNKSPGIDSINWVFGDGSVSNVDSVVHRYLNSGDYAPALKVFDLESQNCNIELPVYIYNVKASIGYDNKIFCASRNVYFQNSSSGNDNNLWTYSDGRTSTLTNPVDSFSYGEQYITLEVSNKAGCTDKDYDTLFFNENPEINLGKDWYVCAGESVQLSASGGDSIFWVPSNFLDDPTSYTPIATPTSTQSYQANVVNTANGCKSTGFILVDVVPTPVWNVTLETQKDTVIIGDLDTISVTLNGNYEYSWSSDDSIVSHTDTILVVRPQVTKDDYAYYNIRVFDPRECFEYTNAVQIYVREGYTFGIPEAFSPNTDGINDIIKVDGWGIKRLIEFRVFNRWGNEIFYTDDIDTGWDGSIDGTPQPIDTYGYVIKIERWDGEIEEQRGTFSLVR